ncbi:putative leucine-rich repeat-containing protein DDB_G0290503 [Chironomus tepperi]|uniref:putative leucine-rich repeat-containing protein DDB_G0290503 n=1 Tax=Chironomus tepperi TaxID=113505 RepID=UPI00391F65FE
MLQLTITTSTLSIVCDFKTAEFVLLQTKYKCEVKKDLTISSKNSTEITSITGSHKTSKSNDNVAVFKVHDFTVNYFPTGLEVHFKNLEGISINKCNLMEIHQADLKPLPKLTYLDLSDNNIEIIAAELFKFNQNLRLIWLKRNKITHIDSNVFNGLKELTNLNLRGNICTDLKGTDAIAVKNVITTFNHTCKNQEYLKMKHNESIPEKIEQFGTENASLVNNVTEMPKDSLFDSIAKLITQKFDENFNKTQKLFTDLSEKVNKIEQNLTETKYQVANLLEFNSISTKTIISILQEVQTMSNKYESLINITSKFESILESQNKDIKASKLEPDSSQCLGTISEDLEEVKRTLNKSQRNIEDAILNNALNVTSELQKLSQDIERIENKIISDVQAELKEVKSDLMDVKMRSQSESISTTISTITVEMKNINESTSVPTTSQFVNNTEVTEEDTNSPNSKESTTEATKNENDSSTQPIDTKDDETTQSLNLLEDTTQADESKDDVTTKEQEIEQTQSPDNVEPTTQEADQMDESSLATGSTTQTPDPAQTEATESTNLTTQDKESVTESTTTAIDSTTQNEPSTQVNENSVDKEPDELEETTTQITDKEEGEPEETTTQSAASKESAENNENTQNEANDDDQSVTTPSADLEDNSTVQDNTEDTGSIPESPKSDEMESNIEDPIIPDETTIKAEINSTEKVPLNSEENEV